LIDRAVTFRRKSQVQKSVFRAFAVRLGRIISRPPLPRIPVWVFAAAGRSATLSTHRKIR